MNWIPFLVFPLVGGYGFSLIWYPSSYKSKREDGHRLYFRAVFYGICLTIAASLTHVLLFSSIEQYHNYLNILKEFVDPESKTLSISGRTSIFTVLTATILGPILGHIFNFPAAPILKKFPPFALYTRKLFENVIQNDDLEKLLYRGMKYNFPVMLTLSTGKTYVGYAIRVPNPDEVKKAIRILPLLSGFRNKDTLELTFTTNYSEVYNLIESEKAEEYGHLEVGDFELVIPAENLCSISLFDVDLYVKEFILDNNVEPSNSEASEIEQPTTTMQSEETLKIEKSSSDSFTAKILNLFR